MIKTAKFFLVSGISVLLLIGCGKKSEVVESEESTPEPEPSAPVVEGARNLTPEEQGQVVDALLKTRAKQQAEGLGGGQVVVNGAWNYTGFSTLSPDPSAAIEARDPKAAHDAMWQHIQSVSARLFEQL